MENNPVRAFALVVVASSVVAGLVCFALFVLEELVGSCMYGCEGDKPPPHDQIWVGLTALGTITCGVVFIGAIAKAYSARPGPLSAPTELRRQRAKHVVWTAVTSLVFLVVGARADLNGDTAVAFACEIGVFVGVVAMFVAVIAMYTARAPTAS